MTVFGSREEVTLRPKMLGDGTIRRVDGSVGQDDPRGEQVFFCIVVAETEAAVQPDAIPNDLSWESVMFVRASWQGGGYRKPQNG